MVEVRDLRKQFGPVAAVDGVSFIAADAEITGLLGENGAGKTTTLAMIGGVLKADGGSVHIDGVDADASPQGRRQLGALLDHAGMYSRLTARENIRYFGALHGLSGRHLDERVSRTLTLFGLEPLAGRRIQGFSQGERMKVALGRAVVHEPRNVLLDEPTNGLDVTAVRAVPLACLAAALQLLVSASCRTTKEAYTWLTFVVFVPMLAGMFVVFYPLAGSGWFALPVLGQQLIVQRTLGGAPPTLFQGVTLAVVTAGVTIPALAGVARVLDRDQVLAR
jgi:sodium transport system ATP-binding protein